MKVRILLMHGAMSAVLTGIVSCGGGGYGGGSSAGGTTTYTVGGTLAGANGAVTLKLNGANDLILSTPGSFTFVGGIAYLVAYTVTATSAMQMCNVGNASGTMGLANITNVAVTCV